MTQVTTPLAAQAVMTSGAAPSIGKFNIYSATSGSISATLPALSGLNVGARLSVGKYVGDSSTNTVTISCSGSDKFQDGSTASLVLYGKGTQRELQVIEVSSTKYWQIVGGVTYPTAAGEAVTTSNTATLSNKTLSYPKLADTLLDANGANLMTHNATSSAVNYLVISNRATGVAPSVGVGGSDTNIDLNLLSKNSGVVKANSVEVATVSGTQSLTNKSLTSPKIVTSILDTNGNTLMGVTATGSAVNYLNVANTAASGKPTLAAAGSDANIGMSFDAKGSGQQVMRDGTGAIRAIFSGNAGNYFAFDAASTPTILLDGASTDVGMTITTKGAGTVTVYVPTGQTSVVRASGVDSNVDLDLRSKGTGAVKINSNPAAYFVSAPATAGATGTAGAMAYDSTYLYICTATNTWRRIAHATW